MKFCFPWGLVKTVAEGQSEGAVPRGKPALLPHSAFQPQQEAGVGSVTDQSRGGGQVHGGTAS